jgi:hypothetical protein
MAALYKELLPAAAEKKVNTLSITYLLLVSVKSTVYRSATPA